jgi:hypothetical protein
VTSRTVASRDRPRRARVAHNRRFKRGVVFVTRVALRRGRNVRRGLEHSRRATCNVTTRTGTGRRRRMREGGARPYSRRVVARITLRGGRNMRRSFCLCVDGGVRATVTGRTVSSRDRPRRARVTHHRRLKRGVVFVTRVALRGGRNVCCRLKHSRCTTCNVTR